MLVASTPRRFKQLPGWYWLTGLLAFAVGAFISFLVVQTDYGFLLLAAIGGGILALTLTLNPTWSIYILIFIVYTRLSDVLVNFHGAPSIAKLYDSLLIALNDSPLGSVPRTPSGA